MIDEIELLMKVQCEVQDVSIQHLIMLILDNIISFWTTMDTEIQMERTMQLQNTTGKTM